MTRRNITFEIDARIAVVTVNRPEVRNALDRAAIAAMSDAVAEAGDRDDVGVIIFTGAGSDSFVAGADLNELRQRRRQDALAAATSRLYEEIERCVKPTIAAVNGSAIGGGCELALACDLRIAALHARFAQPEVGLGIIPAAGATQRLPRLIGLGRAKYMILTGQAIGADVAVRWGLVSEAVPGEQLMPAARRLATLMLTRGPLALRLSKLALHASSRVDVDSGLLIEGLAQALCFESPEMQEGTAAFLEKRVARFHQQDARTTE